MMVGFFVRRMDAELATVELIPRTWYREYGKRWMDIVFSAIAILFCAPLYCAIAIAIRLTSKGPVFLAQPRVGKGGKLFPLLKFRTMVVDATPIETHARQLAKQGVLYKVENDPRVTKLGKQLRRFSLDELPQLFNVLKGDMSLVGPRPLLPFMVEPFPRENRARTQVQPGITGLWQICARGESSSVLQMIRYDIAYQQDLSFVNDVRILCTTVPVVLRGVGVK